MKHLWRLFLIIPIALITLGCNNDDDDDDSMNPDEGADLPNLVEAAQSANLTTLLDAVGAVDGLDQALLDAEEITVFAPTNEAFGDALAAFDAANLTELVEALGGVQNLEIVLEYHVVATAALSSDLQDGQTLTTLAGQTLTVGVDGSNVSLTDAGGNTVNVVTADVEIENGVVHVIDDVLLPELTLPSAPNLVEAATSAGLTTLLDAVGAVDGLDQTLLDAEAITVFAPTNDAFANALAAFNAANLNELVEALGGVENLELVLGFHVVPAIAFAEDLSEGAQTFTTLAGQDLTVTRSGSDVSVTDAEGNTFNVTTANVEIANGVVHVIDGVLLPELPAPNLVEAATDAGLTTLLDAVGAVAGLDQTLLDAEAITVFAPTNDAFSAALMAYGVDNLDDLVTELGGVDSLEKVLGFHVVPAVAFAEDLSEGAQTFTTLAGEDLTVTRTGSAVSVTDAAGNTYDVTTADVEIANGVVHVIDGVLLPSFEYPNVVDAATAAGLTTLLDAVTAASLGQTLLDAEAITVFGPTNDAFADLLAVYGVSDLNGLINRIGAGTVSDVLQYHVVPSVAFSHDLSDGQVLTTLEGSNLTVNIDGEGNVTLTDVDGLTYNVTATDAVIANGVVHVIDGVVLPLDRPTLVEAATSANLNTLLAAIAAVDGLDQTLLDAETITVFGPTDQAFTDLLTATNSADLDELITNIGGVANLETVLSYHVVPSVAYAGDLSDGQELTTLAGDILTVNIDGMGNISLTDVDGATYNVTASNNVTIENGVVHVIDGVVTNLN